MIMKKGVGLYGILAGVIVAVFMVTSTVLCYREIDYNSSLILGYIGMILAFSMIFFGIKNQRDRLNNGTISFVQALKTGGAIMFIASTVYVVVWLFEYYIFMPDFLDRYAAHALKQAKESGAGAKEIESIKEQVNFSKNTYKTPFGVVLMTYLKILPPGIIITLISALVLKRKSSSTEAGMAVS
jgi:hypothetical protein